MSSLASRIAFTSLTATKTAQYQQLIDFYTAFGFKVVRVFNKDAHVSPAGLTGVSSDSRAECWVASFPVTRVDAKGDPVPFQETVEYSHPEFDSQLAQFNRGVMLKIRLISHDAHKNPELPGRLIVLTTDLAQVRAVASKQGCAVSEEKGHLYVVDPVGNTVGFTTEPFPGFKVGTRDDFLVSAKDAAKAHALDAHALDAQPQISVNAGKKTPKKIAVMTSGGDSPGMCAAVRAVVRTGIYFGCEMYGCYEGYTGLVTGGDKLRPLGWEDVRGWLSEGGTLIGTARCMEFKERAGRLSAAQNMVLRGIDALVVCGGDGSLTGADIFRSEWPSLLEELERAGRISAAQHARYRDLTIVGMVGSIDNDMIMTDNTIGAYSSLERICEMVDYIDTTAASHSRAFVVEVMGRNCGWLALMAGVCCGADYVFVPEQPPCARTWRRDLQRVCTAHRARGRRKTTVIVAEGAIDDELHHISSQEVKDALVDLGFDTRVTTLGHVQRGGSAVAFDRLLATMQGVEAVKAVLENTPETPSPMIGIEANKVVRVPLVEAVKRTKAVAKAIAARDFKGAFELRDEAFKETWADFKAITGETEREDASEASEVSETSKASAASGAGEGKDSASACADSACACSAGKAASKPAKLNLAIIHTGAPTAALNAATRAAVLYLLSRGHTVYGVENGFSGLIHHGSLRKLSWLDVIEWHNVGGSFLGTNRSLPSADMGTVAFYLQKFNIDGLIVMGGFEAYRAVHELQQARKQYPVFNIPVVCLPSTVSNNVPGTEYSLGCDTCLNVLTGYCDAIKQSASASRKRVFVVEVQGGNCGYVASYTGLVTGAVAVYRPETGISLGDIGEDLRLLDEIYSASRGEDRSGKIVVRNENSSEIYTTQLVADLLREQAHGQFETRAAIPGHVQQGRLPTAMDRCYAARFAIKACKYVERNSARIGESIRLMEKEGFGSNATDHGRSDEQLKFVYRHGQRWKVPELDNAVVLGIHGNRVSFEAVDALWARCTDVQKRRGVDVHWQQMNVVNDMLSGRLLVRRREQEEAK